MSRIAQVLVGIAVVAVCSLASLACVALSFAATLWVVVAVCAA